ncbi:nuclease-related domain-containing protein [Anabaena azotica]|uniref:NERD domain-containing protein n=1 Tax=Anabaena azotica FACHB-119 TaxID=947527 RepID=A0ABR8DEN2_9NOST|nr:nuclease-related domain-containing protein [Anabaena azotica]MBD2505392.1 NERD domain-containing protein [Anabaena azotica FACHB-119]
MKKITNTNSAGGAIRRQVRNTIGRLTLTGIISFGIGGAVTFDRYNNYWNQTIFRVQTVDFNILSHTLPTKLSYALLKKQPEEVQRTLDSNYSLFGLIVTDSSGQKIVAYSGKNSGKSSSWKAALDPQQLQSHPYDLLLDPPPVYAQWTYSKPQATERTATKFTNQGRVIGRVYYVRGVRPTFQEDMITLLNHPFSGSSRIQTYTTSLIACFGATLLIWSGLEFILYRKRVDQEKAQREAKLAEERQEDLINNNQILQVQLKERIDELQLLQKQINDERNQFEEEADKFNKLNNKLQQEIVKLTESLRDISVKFDKDEELKKQLINLKKSVSEYEERENLLKKLANEAKDKSENLAIEIASLEKELLDNHPLNDFETSILNSLQQNFPDKKVFVQFDVANGNKASMCTDFIVVMNNCCIVIEAKHYLGKIQSIGYPRNTGWVCKTNTQTKNIRACWGRNPYEQVWTYSVSLYGRVRISNENKLPVYGIVIFPTGSFIDDNIKSNISRFYRVTTLDNLKTTIQDLENKARFKNRTGLAYQQILEQLTGIFNKQSA